MAWIINEETIEEKEDLDALLGVPAFKVFGALVYAAYERHYAGYQVPYTLEDCEDLMLYNHEYWYTYHNSLDDVYGFIILGHNPWADPDAGDGSGNFSGLTSIPELNASPDVKYGDSMTDAVWAYIEYLSKAKYVYFSAAEPGYHREVCGITTYTYYENENENDPDPRNRTVALSVSKSSAIAVDVYSYKGDRFSVTEPLQLQRSSPASESSFTLSGYSIYPDRTFFAIVAKPEFQFS